MSAFLAVTCACGCENRVPAERRDRIAICVACGNELQITTHAAPEPSVRTPMPEPPAPPLAPTPHRAHSPFEEEPSAATPKHRFTTYAPPLHERIGEHCTQCGRELRGAWDRLETGKGVLCYACANLATDGVPERIKHLMDADGDTGRGRPRPVAHPARALPSWWMTYRSSALKAGVVTATVIFFAVSFVLTYFNIALPIPAIDWGTASAPTVRDVNELSVLPTVLYYGWTFVSRSVFVFVALFVTLFFTNSLLRERFVENMLHTAGYCAPFIVVELIRILGALVYGLDPARGPLFYVLGNAVQSLTLLFIALELFDESVTACVYFIGAVVCMLVFTPILNGLVFQSLSAL